jgi:hypothetical protein
MGEEFTPFYDSVAPAGISAASLGLIVGLKAAVKVGVWKLGIAGFIKAAGSFALGATALPLAAGVGTLAYMYSKYSSDQLK